MNSMASSGGSKDPPDGDVDGAAAREAHGASLPIDEARRSAVDAAADSRREQPGLADQNRQSGELKIAASSSSDVSDCGHCQFCLDKPKFGGANKKKQMCKKKAAAKKAVAEASSTACSVDAAAAAAAIMWTRESHSSDGADEQDHNDAKKIAAAEVVTIADEDVEVEKRSAQTDAEYFSTINEKEIEWYKTNVRNPETVVETSLTCTSCFKQITGLSGNNFFRHPLLAVLICGNCKHFYEDGEWSKDVDGNDEFCRWCANGGELILCDGCPYSFCKQCIQRNLGRKVVQEIKAIDAWKCLVCKPQQIRVKKANYYAVFLSMELEKERKKKKKELGREQKREQEKKRRSDVNQKKAEEKKEAAKKNEEDLLKTPENFVDENLREAFKILGVYQRCLEDTRRRWIRGKKRLEAAFAASVAKNLRKVYAVTKQNMDRLDSQIIQSYKAMFPNESIRKLGTGAVKVNKSGADVEKVRSGSAAAAKAVSGSAAAAALPSSARPKKVKKLKQQKTTPSSSQPQQARKKFSAAAAAAAAAKASPLPSTPNAAASASGDDDAVIVMNGSPVTASPSRKVTTTTQVGPSLPSGTRSPYRLPSAVTVEAAGPELDANEYIEPATMLQLQVRQVGGKKKKNLAKVGSAARTKPPPAKRKKIDKVCRPAPTSTTQSSARAAQKSAAATSAKTKRATATKPVPPPMPITSVRTRPGEYKVSLNLFKKRASTHKEKKYESSSDSDSIEMIELDDEDDDETEKSKPSESTIACCRPMMGATSLTADDDAGSRKRARDDDESAAAAAVFDGYRPREEAAAAAAAAKPPPHKKNKTETKLPTDNAAVVKE